DPLLLAVEPAGPPDESGEGEDRPVEVAGIVQFSSTPTVADGEFVPDATVSPPHESPLLAGFGDLSLIVAGFRFVRGRPAPSSNVEADAWSPEQLAFIAALPAQESAAPGVAIAAAQPSSDADPTRPRVLRTALIGAAALAV